MLTAEAVPQLQAGFSGKGSITGKAFKLTRNTILCPKEAHLGYEQRLLDVMRMFSGGLLKLIGHSRSSACSLCLLCCQKIQNLKFQVTLCLSGCQKWCGCGWNRIQEKYVFLQKEIITTNSSSLRNKMQNDIFTGGNIQIQLLFLFQKGASVTSTFVWHCVQLFKGIVIFWQPWLQTDSDCLSHSELGI